MTPEREHLQAIAEAYQREVAALKIKRDQSFAAGHAAGQADMREAAATQANVDGYHKMAAAIRALPIAHELKR